MDSKITIRNKLVSWRSQFTGPLKIRADRSIETTVLDLPLVANAQTICIYLSLPEEVDTRGLVNTFFRQGKTVVVPKIYEKRLMLMHIQSWSDVRPGEFGILEPLSTCQFIHLSTVNLFIVPGVAFDRNGSRIGRGKGYYDLLLRHVSVPVIGLAYSQQIIAEVPHTSYDVPVTLVVTEKEKISIREEQYG